MTASPARPSPLPRLEFSAYKDGDMAQPGAASLLRNFWRGSKTGHALKTVPSILRGFTGAQNWTNLVAERSQKSALATPCEMPNPLRTYFDSVTKGRGVWKWLHYFDIYHRHFHKFVGKEVRVLEVGIYSGGSLEMWKAYFGPNCWIYGVDIEQACKSYEDDRTRVFIGDQADRRFWRNLREQVPELDIVIDDGGHRTEQRIVTLEETLPYLRPGGVYVCEDIHGSNNRFAAYLYGLTTGLNATANATRPPGGFASSVVTSSFQRSIGSVHLYPFVAVIERTCSPVAELVSVRHGTHWQPFL